MWHSTVRHRRRALRCAMSDMLQARVVLEAGVLLLLHHLVMVWCASRVSRILFSALVILVVVASLVSEVLRALVFVRGAILWRCQCPVGHNGMLHATLTY